MSATQVRTFEPGISRPATLGELWLHLHAASEAARIARSLHAARAQRDDELLAQLQELLMADVRDRLTEIILGREEACPARCVERDVTPDCTTCRGRGFLRVDGLEARITRVMADLNVELPSITERLAAAITAETVEIDI